MSEHAPLVHQVGGANRAQILVAVAASACVAFVLMQTSSAATNLLVRPAMTTTTVGTILAPRSVPQVSGAIYESRAQNVEIPTPLQGESFQNPASGDYARASIATKPWFLVLPVAALAAFFVALRKSIGGPRPISLESVDVALAPTSGYKVTSSRPTLALKAEIDESVVGEKYEVTLPKPIGIVLGRGNDGATYVARVPDAPRFSQFTPGDKVVRCSASFGPEIWEALNYGQVMFAIKTRNGDVFLELEKRGGDVSCFEKKMSSKFSQERAGGNYGAGTAELQAQNYIEQKELEKKREGLWREAVGLVKNKKYEEALVIFENVIGLEPTKYIGDDFAATSDLFRVSHYQMACVYSLLNNVDAAMESLREALTAGYSDYDQIREDPDLALVRESDEFDEMMSKYDEGVINMEAINALKGAFGGLFGGGK